MISLLCSSSSPSLLPSAPPLSQTLDYETTTSYSVLMRARDEAPPFNENTANITITILDTNDNAPQFSMPGGVFLPPPRYWCLQLYMVMHAVSVLPPPPPPTHTPTHMHRLHSASIGESTSQLPSWHSSCHRCRWRS